MICGEAFGIQSECYQSGFDQIDQLIGLRFSQGGDFGLLGEAMEVGDRVLELVQMMGQMDQIVTNITDQERAQSPSDRAKDRAEWAIGEEEQRFEAVARYGFRWVRRLGLAWGRAWGRDYGWFGLIAPSVQKAGELEGRAHGGWRVRPFEVIGQPVLKRLIFCNFAGECWHLMSQGGLFGAALPIGGVTLGERALADFKLVPQGGGGRIMHDKMVKHVDRQQKMTSQITMLGREVENIDPVEIGGLISVIEQGLLPRLVCQAIGPGIGCFDD